MRMNRALIVVMGGLMSAVGLGGMAASAAPSTQPTTRPYPLKTCVVSGEELGSMGKAVIVTHEGREVRLCCSGCVEDFKADPAKYIKKLIEAEKAPTTKPAEHH